MVDLIFYNQVESFIKIMMSILMNFNEEFIFSL